MGKRLRDLYPHATGFQVFKWKARRVLRQIAIASLVVGFSSGLLYTAFTIGGVANPKMVYAVKEKLIPDNSVPPILKRIAQAESLNSHYCTDTLVKAGMCAKGALGQVLVNPTRDIGKYGINLLYNGKWCAGKGYNLFIEADNEQCALELFRERGSEPWSASKANWNK